MKLGRLAERSGASTATIKYWVREGILPPGRLRNQTTAEYSDRHVERIQLIKTLRRRFNLSIVDISNLTGMIDDECVPLIEVMQECQLIATGLRRPRGDVPEDYVAVATTAVCRAGWPDVPSVARAALAEALWQADQAGFQISADGLVRYAEAISRIAQADVERVMAAGEGESRSRDGVALGLLVGADIQVRLLLAVNQLAHTSAAINAELAAD